LKKLLLLVVVALSALTLSACNVLEQLIPQDTVDLQETMMSTRNFLVTTNVGLYVEDERQGLLPGRSDSRLGSGVVFHEDDEYYYVLSSYHVIEPTHSGESTYEVKPYGEDPENTIPSELIFYCEASDLALLRFDSTSADMNVIDIHTRYGESLRRGELIFAVGNPSGIDSVVTFGEYIRRVTIDRVEFPVIAHNAQIYPGNSGGLLADLHGNLIGINNWSSQSLDQNYAVGLDEIHEFLEASEHPFNFE